MLCWQVRAVSDWAPALSHEEEGASLSLSAPFPALPPLAEA